MGFPVSPRAILTVLCSGDDLGVCRLGFMINQARGWLGRLSINPVSWMIAENSILLIFLGQGVCHMSPDDLQKPGISRNFTSVTDCNSRTFYPSVDDLNNFPKNFRTFKNTKLFLFAMYEHFISIYG